MMIIITIKIPYCFSGDCDFIGINLLIKNNIVPLISLICIIIGVYAYYDFKWVLKGNLQLPFEIIEITNVDYEHITFLTTYIIPLVTFNFLDIRYQIVFVILILVIGIIYIRTDLFYANPTLAILRFRIYRVAGKFRNNTEKKDIILISKDILSKGDNVRYIKLDNRIFYAIKL